MATEPPKSLGELIAELKGRWEQEGYLAKAQREITAEHEEQLRRERAEWLEDMQRRGIPREHREQLWEGLRPTDCAKAAHRFMSEPEKRILVLAGTKGSGKTQAASWCVRRHGRFVDASELERVNRYDRDLMRSYETASTLVLDDLGTEYLDARGYMLSLLDNLLKVRHAAKRKTVATTNLGWEDFRKHYGERIADRVRDGVFFATKSPSLRGRRD